jgi:hypothetical protein
VVTEGTWYTDFSPELLGVIRDADTPDAYFDELVEVPEFTPGGFTPYLEGWMDDGTGQQALAMSEISGNTGVQWIPWWSDGAGFAPNGNGVAVPSRWWSPPAYEVLDGVSLLSISVGRHQQAILEGLYTDSGYVLVEWGRALDELGPPVTGVSAEGCTFYASSWVDHGTSTETATGTTGETADTGGTTSAPPPGPEERGCGCDGAGGSSWLAVLLGLLARRGRRR